jgi:DNA-directed RNA polymerase specialized sigma24 family protein
LSDVKSGQQAGEFATQRRTWLLAQALNVCRNRTDAEDLVQEASLRFIHLIRPDMEIDENHGDVARESS